MFKYLVLISSLIIAGVAAFFSVSGLAKLFAGAFIPVVIMAASLEIGKLVTASFLTRRWKDISFILRSYYMIATFVLIVITSLGIYGFLTSAYQITADQYSILTQQTAVLELRKQRYEEQLDLSIAERERISTTINELAQGLSNNLVQYVDSATGQLVSSTSGATRNAIQEQLNISNEERSTLAMNIEELTDSIISADLQVIELNSTNEAAAEVGPLRYLSNLTGWSMDRVVNVFALLIIFVFDPLAVSLIVGYNRLHMKDNLRRMPNKKYKIYEEEKISPVVQNNDAEILEYDDSDNIEPLWPEEVIEEIDEGVDNDPLEELSLIEEIEDEDVIEKRPDYVGLARDKNLTKD